MTYPDTGNAAIQSKAKGWRHWFCYDEQIWLVYLAFWFIQPYYDRSSAKVWIELAVAMFLFLVCYVLAHRGDRRFRWFWAFGILLIGLVYVPRNQSACGIYIFLAATLPEFTDSSNVAVALIIAECVIVTLESLLLHLSPWTWSVGGGFAAIIGINAIRRRQQERGDAKLRLAHSEIEQLAKTAERERIARDMHDVLGHSLSLIVLKSELAGHLLTSQPAKAALEVAEIEATARKALAEVRRTISGYRAESFTAEISKAAHMLEAAGVRLQTPETTPALTPRHEAMLAMVLREAVTNIVRHARASECSIEFNHEQASTHMVIADNGRGNILTEGNGLRGMRERVQEVGGRLQLDSQKGTRLQIELPQSAVETLAD